jgi:NADPH-dependent curcumin reductase CurA
VAAAISGSDPPAALLRVAIRKFTVLGSMGSLNEFRDLYQFVEDHGLRPPVRLVFDGVEQVPEALRALDAGQPLGKLIVRIRTPRR